MSSTLYSGPASAASNNLRTVFQDSLWDYLRAHGSDWQNSLRLYMGYGISLGRRLILPRRFECVGACIPGTSNLQVSVDGARFYVRPGTNDLDLLLHHESRTLGWFRPRPGEVVVDVGAHIGRYTMIAAPVARIVVAIEPDPHNFEILQENVRLNGFRNVRLQPLAISDRQGVRRLRLATTKNRGTSTLEPPAGPAGEAPGTDVADVLCDTLDDLLTQQSIAAIDWLKIDVEGHEAAVLRSGVRTLRATRNIILEVTRGHEEQCLRLLDAAGFEQIDEDAGEPTTNWLLRRRRREA